jgi:Chlorophyllase
MTPNWLKTAGKWLRRYFSPSDTAWTAASYALLTLWGLLLVSLFFGDGSAGVTWESALGVATIFGLMALVSVALLLIGWLLGALKLRYRAALLLCLPPLSLVAYLSWGMKGLMAVPVLIITLSLLLGAGVVLIRPGVAGSRRTGTWVFFAVGVVLAGLSAYVLLKSAPDLNPALTAYHLRGRTLDLRDPGQPGPYGFKFFTYGSGDDRHRPEYAEGVTFRTKTVDGSKLDEKWTGLGGWVRKKYWGFGADSFPVQGRVWMPVGARDAALPPCPLVLIVHGNHGMESFSEPGYAYLGELLASQGFIVVSVDENFLNSSLADFINPFGMRIGKENSVRAWMLLEHLSQWRDWTQDKTHPMFGKADLSRIALIGHSRGGEAVATANAFNDLSHYPDDATLAFNYHFKLGAIAAIAPVDGQYQPRDRPVPMRDTNYFTLQGSMDGDLTSFMGSSQYSRASFSGNVNAFKASLYLSGANHGQFNTVWGRYDNGQPFKLLLDARRMIEPDAQRRIAKVYLSAFLQLTLQGEERYRPLFEDARNGAGWLPDGFLINNYADSSTRWLANFEEDLDPATGSSPGVTIDGQNLSVWREDFVALKFSTLDTHVVLLGWDERFNAGTATYRINLSDSEPAITAESSLVFGASNAAISSLPESFHPKGIKLTSGEEGRQPLDWSIILTDATGTEARLPISHDQLLYPQIKSYTRRFGALSSVPSSELVMRRYSFPLEDFVTVNPRLDVKRLRSIRFDFDRTPRGVIALDDVGLARAP